MTKNATYCDKHVSSRKCIFFVVPPFSLFDRVYIHKLLKKTSYELLTKELNTLKLAHETILGDHRELLRTHEKLRFEKLNLEQEHEFLKAINDDLRKKSSSLIAFKNSCSCSRLSFSKRNFS